MTGKKGSGKRLREILGVLKKHHLSQGVSPEKLREILEDLGPTYVKLGQIMSMRSDMLPEKYCRELTRLRTEVRPLPFETILQIIKQELGRPFSQIFKKVEPQPLGSASIAQVHAATLLDGRKVVVKVQRPAIHEMMENDIRLMRRASGLLKLTSVGNLIDFGTIIDELWKTSQEEMDFKQEAKNCDLFFENQKDIVYITSPQVIHELTTPRLLVMSYIEGIQIDRVQELTELGYDMKEIGEKTAANYCKQILDDGFFHADPHPGNLWISGGQIAWLDLGMTGHLSGRNKMLIQKAVYALLQNDIYGVKNVLLSMGEAKARINHAELYTDIDDIVSKYMNMGFGEMRLGELIEKLLDLVKKHHIAINTDITMLARSMITIEGTLSACAPQVNLMQILTSYVSSSVLEHIDLKRELRHKIRQIYTSTDKMLSIPALLSDLLNITKNGQTRLNIDITESDRLLDSFRRSFDHLVLALLACGIFIGSALLCLSDQPHTLWGLPVISVIGFFLCLIFVLWLIIQMFLHRKK